MKQINFKFCSVLVEVSFPKKEFQKLSQLDMFKEVIHITNSKPYSLGEIIGVTKEKEHFSLDIEIRKDETPMRYFSSIIKEAKDEEIQISGTDNNTKKISIKKGTVGNIVMDGEKFVFKTYPDNLIVQSIIYKLIIHH